MAVFEIIDTNVHIGGQVGAGICATQQTSTLNFL